MTILSRSQLKELSAEVLGVDADADDSTIREAYRDKTKTFHPDVGDEPDKDKFKAIDVAQDILRSDREYIEEKNDQRNASNAFIRALDRDIEEAEDEVIEEVNIKEEYQIAIDFAVSVMVDLAFSEIAEIFEIPPTSQKFEEALSAQIISAGYSPQQLDTLTAGEMARFTDRFLIEDVTTEELEEILEDINEQVAQEYGFGSTIASVSKVIGTLIAGGIISPEDIGENQEDTGPWEYSGGGDSGPWRRTRGDSGAWSR